MAIMHVKVLGPAGTFGHEAGILSSEWLRDQFGDIRIGFVRQNGDVLRAAAFNKCVGLVPVYNSDAGLVKGVMDFWLQQHKGFKSHLIGVKKLRVQHQLLMHESITRPSRQIRAVISHPHALHQTHDHLNKMGIWSRREATSTAEAARLVARERKWRTTAAIASELAGNTYGLKLWRANIEDSPDNFTIFQIFGPKATEPTKHDRTVLIIRTEDKPGRLEAMLGAIRAEHSNLRTIRQISLDGAAIAAFYCQFDGHRHTDVGRRILREMNEVGDVIVLGSYAVGSQE